MTLWKWVLLRGLTGMLGLLNLEFGVYSASLSGLTSANETSHFRVCANICVADPAGKSCYLFCTSRRQFDIQSNTVAGERDVVVSVKETRRDACPTLCRGHGLTIWLLFCTCDPTDTSQNPEDRPVPVQVVANSPPCKKVCELPCEAEELIQNHDNSPECPEGKDLDFTTRINKEIRSGRHRRSLMDPEVFSYARGVSSNTTGGSKVAGERDGVEMIEFGNDERQRTTEGENPGAERMQDDFDLDEFCRIECARGNGGLACNCDVIP